MPTQYTPNDLERFYAKISKIPTERGCLEWMAGLRNGYGHFNIRKQFVYAHRFAWELVNGPVPDDLVVCHHCDNPRCVNTDHLFLGTKADNTHDMIEKGRAVHSPRYGESIGTSKLTAQQVLEIRSEKYANWYGTDIAAEFGVTETLISSILNRRSWRHLGSTEDAPVPDRTLRGERKPNAKLTEDAVREIRSGRFDGWTHLAIGRHFGVSYSVVSNVINRKTWTHI